MGFFFFFFFPLPSIPTWKMRSSSPSFPLMQECNSPN